MDAKTRDEKIADIIREMIKEDRHVINWQIAKESTKRLNVIIDNVLISKIRNQIGLGMYDLISRDKVELLDKSIKNYLKRHPKDKEVVERFIRESWVS